MNIGTWKLIDSRGNILPASAQGSLDLAATGLNEVLQNVLVICNTRVGTVWGDRRFGLDFKFLDAPQNVAQMIIVAEVCAGLTHFEPRVTFANIAFAPSLTNPGEMDVTLGINIDASELLIPNG